MTTRLIVPHDAPKDLIRAAGGVIVRSNPERGPEVACIYREARGDWTFPKGKLDPGEGFAEAALREVWEETGLRCRVERFIGTTNYTHRKGRPKIVAYYLMEIEDGAFAPNAEVDDLVWLTLDEVATHLTWDRDRELFSLVLEQLAA